MRSVDERLESLAARVEQLERRNRVWRRMSFLGVASAVASLLLLTGRGPTAQDVRAAEDKTGVREVKARRFVVVDDKGKERGYFGLDPSNITPNVTYLWFYDGDNTSMVLLFAGNKAAEIDLDAGGRRTDSKKVFAIMSASARAGKPQIRLSDESKVLFEQP
jgi:hypothetical protein